MDKDRAKGTGKEAAGKGKQAIGKMTGDNSTRAGGKFDELKGKVQKSFGRAKDKSR